ncbi:bifunctional 3-deoxy-7-phosphoheptulonate synthase/chorismate mutase [Tenuibacillus multivorans]|uniref:3-deoxy-D-arabinoheptulosonate-7-phosphate synthase /chorismate mutase n=1 Tax=Tenuibacillus multivorans TaxID=237069 RepID=A0A1H0EF87_9BACI|nr:bifunctional 3-deoxy-7-phosphoheptulonate synthase/chorismate mutase [Tenuibacillus multivorans]GEL77183.1 bifunctional 3-deoxy-7-phosphoheptulonate synthase/chorismate mutase [Tenuibacillus multivorans]SDN81013.1 3-deoxy-D-arabinoheptulosonate-7-phosphate synthase /chorismate mutase [Tenuibacillus multivorans]
MNPNNLDKLRKEVDQVNLRILDLINRRGELIKQIGDIKKEQGIKVFDPIREREMLDLIIQNNNGPFEKSTVNHLFKEIFKAAKELIEEEHLNTLLISRQKKPNDTVVDIDGVKVGNSHQEFIFGPCSVETYEQVDEVAQAIKAQDLSLLRGGAFKPRTSPYDFQGLGIEGLKILKDVGEKHDLKVISEIVNPKDIEAAHEYLDVIQIGARNMHNFELLKEAGRSSKPIFLKRGLSATINEFMNAAEYIMSQGNGQIILCERGIRTYETATRNTLDITAVPILKKETHLPVFVDVTHSTGRRDLLLPAAKAALAIGVDGIMAEVHPDPATALSDSQQQMDIPTFQSFMQEIK